MCDFVDDGASIFPLALLQSCMLDIWKPLTELVDAGSPAPATDAFPAVLASTWTGLPTDGTAGGTIVNPTVHNANIQYVVDVTTKRTAAQATAQLGRFHEAGGRLLRVVRPGLYRRGHSSAPFGLFRGQRCTVV